MRIRYALCGKDFVLRSLGEVGREDLAWSEYPCLLWDRGTEKDGYGHFKMPGSRAQTKVHRYAWETANGPIPDGFSVLHHCDTPRCFRPSHLFLGTHKDNMEDMARKGRQGHGAANCPERMPRGEKHPNSKLTDEKVRAIRHLYARGGRSTYAIGAEFGIGQSLAWQVIKGKIWRHVA